MPKVYRLGLNDSIQVQDQGTLALAHSSRVGGYSNYGVGAARATSAPVAVSDSIVEMETPNNADEEEAFLKEAIKASLEAEKKMEVQKQFGSGGSYTQGQDNREQGQPDLLIDFMSEPGPVPAPAPSNFSDGMNQELVVNPMNATPFSAYAIQQPAPANAYPDPPTSIASADPFAPPPAIPTPIVANSTASIASSFTGTNSYARTTRDTRIWVSAATTVWCSRCNSAVWTADGNAARTTDGNAARATDGYAGSESTATRDATAIRTEFPAGIW